MVRPRTRRTALFYRALGCNGRPRKGARNLRLLTLHSFPQAFPASCTRGKRQTRRCGLSAQRSAVAPTPWQCFSTTTSRIRVGKVGECFGQAEQLFVALDPAAGRGLVGGQPCGKAGGRAAVAIRLAALGSKIASENRRIDHLALSPG